MGEDFTHEGVLGTLFTGRLIRRTRVGEYQAVVPTLTGTAWITGLHQFVVDPGDPFPDGFTIGVNDGEAAGQTVMHAHVHVIPRYRGDVSDPRGGIRWVIPEKAAYWSS